jgi:hypothetical protein
MAGQRIRNIKPELCSNRELSKVPAPARWTFLGLLTLIDDEGRCEDEARLIKAHTYPYDDITAADVEEHLAALAGAGIICRYTAGDAGYLHVLRFRDDRVEAHQRSAWGQRPNRPHQSRHPACQIQHETVQDGMFGDEIEKFSERSVNDPPPSTKYQVPRTKDQEPKTLGQLTPAGSSGSFAEFWLVYPRKVAKGAAERAWAKAVKAGADPVDVLAGAARYGQDRAAQDPKFTKHPATWLNGRCWLDEPAVRWRRRVRWARSRWQPGSRRRDCDGPV